MNHAGRKTKITNAQTKHHPVKENQFLSIPYCAPDHLPPPLSTSIIYALPGPLPSYPSVPRARFTVQDYSRLHDNDDKLHDSA